jgi:hypothetical protein
MIALSYTEMADTQIVHPSLEREGWEIMGKVQRREIEGRGRSENIT